MKLWELFGIFIIIMFILAVFGYFSVEQVYLGHYPDDNITPGIDDWIEWHEVKLNESLCAGKEILNTIDICGGHVTTSCKKFWSPAYNWCEIHCMYNQCYWQWWFE